ncbi:MAG: glycosyltransferase [Thermicanus sp.]|nr:glycosyltransferase [Thermicanus sp.]
MDQRVKIIHIIGGGEFGGAEQHILSLLEQIKKNQSYDTEVVTFYEGLLAKRLRERGDPVTVLPQSGRFDLKLYSHLLRLFRQKKPSIIHTHGVRANFFARLAGKKAGVPHIVTTVHSILKHDYPKPAEYLVAKWMEKLTLSFSERYIAVSDAVKEDLIHFGVPIERITVIHNGIHTESYAPGPALSQERERLRRDWGIPPESFLLLTVARLVPVKGIEDLIEGFAIAFANDPSLRLLIVGDGPERKSLERLAMEKKVAGHVLFAGFRQDIPALLAASDLYLNTSLSEGLPLSLMEAMAAEKPVVVTQVGGMKEMIRHEETGLFIPPKNPQAVAEAILRLKRDEPLQIRLGKKAGEEVRKRFSVEAMGQATVNLYESLIEG